MAVATRDDYGNQLTAGVHWCIRPFVTAVQSLVLFEFKSHRVTWEV